jgi:hypothetical protein
MNYFKIFNLFRKFFGIPSKDLIVKSPLLKRFLKEREESKLDCQDPEITEQKRKGLLPSSDIKNLVN